jgi:hypothetical protein
VYEPDIRDFLVGDTQTINFFLIIHNRVKKDDRLHKMDAKAATEEKTFGQPMPI